jgi:predicted DNA-binding transcriptional regulator YafY
MNAILCEAIRARRLVRFAYRGGYRIVEPYCHGIDHNGRDVLRGYQTRGYTWSRRGEGWRLFRVDNLADLAIIEDSFDRPRRGYDPHDHAMAAIHYRV